MSRWYKQGKALLDEIAGSGPQPGEVHIWFTGQHGFIIRLGAIVVYIDVILNELLNKEGKSSREYPPPFNPAETQKVDYVFCTHNHRDHLNIDTLLPLAKANPLVRFVVPAPLKQLLVDAGIEGERIIAARAGEKAALGPSASFVPVPAIHTRYIQDDGEKNQNGDYTALGFVLSGEGFSIYHSGDTWVTPSLINTLKALGPLDIAMLPINGTDWERTGQNRIGNMGFLDAVKLAKIVPVDFVIPSHYDMMAYNGENPAKFVDAMYTLCPEKRFHVFALGERFIFRKE